MEKKKKEYKNSKYKKEEVIEAVIDLRLKQNKSITTIIEVLKEDYGYKTTQCYQYIKWAQEKVAEAYSEKHLKLIEDAIGQMESRMEGVTNDRVWLEYQKELNKLRGLYEEKINVKLEYIAKFQ